MDRTNVIHQNIHDYLGTGVYIDTENFMTPISFGVDWSVSEMRVTVPSPSHSVCSCFVSKLAIFKITNEEGSKRCGVREKFQSNTVIHILLTFNHPQNVQGASSRILLARVKIWENFSANFYKGIFSFFLINVGITGDFCRTFFGFFEAKCCMIF